MVAFVFLVWWTNNFALTVSKHTKHTSSLVLGDKWLIVFSAVYKYSAARNNPVVTCDTSDQYQLLQHKDELKKPCKNNKNNNRRKIGTPANSVSQAKDNHTSQQCCMMAQCLEIALKMQQFGKFFDDEGDQCPTITTSIMTRDKIIEQPYLANRRIT